MNWCRSLISTAPSRSLLASIISSQQLSGGRALGAPSPSAERKCQADLFTPQLAPEALNGYPLLFLFPTLTYAFPSLITKLYKAILLIWSLNKMAPCRSKSSPLLQILLKTVKSACATSSLSLHTYNPPVRNILYKSYHFLSKHNYWWSCAYILATEVVQEWVLMPGKDLTTSCSLVLKSTFLYS